MSIKNARGTNKLTMKQIRAFAARVHINAEHGAVRWAEDSKLKTYRFGDDCGHLSYGSQRLTIPADGARCIQITRAQFIWATVHGYIPRKLRHIDGNPLNDAISNLELCASPYGQYIRREARAGYAVNISKLAVYRAGFKTLREAEIFRDAYLMGAGLPPADHNADPLELEMLEEMRKPQAADTQEAPREPEQLMTAADWDAVHAALAA